jgi:hypothetical protein
MVNVAELEQSLTPLHMVMRCANADFATILCKRGALLGAYTRIRVPLLTHSIWFSVQICWMRNSEMSCIMLHQGRSWMPFCCSCCHDDAQM